MQVTQPQWVTYATIFGVGAILGNLVSFLLTSWWQHRVWVKDNKKLEWRELIDVLREGIRVMGYKFDGIFPNVVAVDAPDDDDEIRRKAEVTIRDRIFISRTLMKSGLLEDWTNLAKHRIYSDSNFDERVEARRRFRLASRIFQTELIRVSREDLGLEPGYWSRLWRKLSEAIRDADLNF